MSLSVSQSIPSHEPFTGYVTNMHMTWFQNSQNCVQFFLVEATKSTYSDVDFLWQMQRAYFSQVACDVERC